MKMTVITTSQSLLEAPVMSYPYNITQHFIQQVQLKYNLKHLRKGEIGRLSQLRKQYYLCTIKFI